MSRVSVTWARRSRLLLSFPIKDGLVMFSVWVRARSTHYSRKGISTAFSEHREFKRTSHFGQNKKRSQSVLLFSTWNISIHANSLACRGRSGPEGCECWSVGRVLRHQRGSLTLLTAHFVTVNGSSPAGAASSPLVRQKLREHIIMKNQPTHDRVPPNHCSPIAGYRWGGHQVNRNRFFFTKSTVILHTLVWISSPRSSAFAPPTAVFHLQTCPHSLSLHPATRGKSSSCAGRVRAIAVLYFSVLFSLDATGTVRAKKSEGKQACAQECSTLVRCRQLITEHSRRVRERPESQRNKKKNKHK